MELSVVTTLYNSSKTINQFYAKITENIEKLSISDYEIIFVNDGSVDDSLEMAISLREKNDKVKIIDFSRNFGHMYALYAGLEASKGDRIFLVDSDLEENPNILVDFYREFEMDENLDVCYGVQKKRKEPVIRRWFSKLYYFLLHKVSKYSYPKDVLTVRLMKRIYIDSILELSEKHIELFVMFSFVGFKQKAIKIQKNYKGKTSYNVRKLILIAINSFTSATNKPNYIITILGLSGVIISGLILLTIKTIVVSSMSNYFAILSIWFLGFLVISAIGIVGVYVSRLITELKKRPRYIIKNFYE